jgi:hypothetical protein
MAVLLSDIKCFAAAVTPESDADLNIGGTIDLTKKHDFSDFSGVWKIFSSNIYDVEGVTLTYRDFDGEIQTELATLNGQTPVNGVAGIERVLKAVKSGSTLGDVALVKQNYERAGTAQGDGGKTNTIQLDAGASAVDGYYTAMVIRITSGAGVGQVAEVLSYSGSSKIAIVSQEWAVAVGATSVFEASRGVFFDKNPLILYSEILYVVRLFYDSFAPPAGDPTTFYHQKIFFKHTDASASGLNLTQCTVAEFADPIEAYGDDVQFDLDVYLNNNSSNGGGNNRKVAPAGFVFDDATKDVPSAGVMAPGDYVGVWLRLTDPAAGPAFGSYFTPRFVGRTT